MHDFPRPLPPPVWLLVSSAPAFCFSFIIIITLIIIIFFFVVVVAVVDVALDTSLLSSESITN